MRAPLTMLVLQISGSNGLVPASLPTFHGAASSKPLEHSMGFRSNLQKMADKLNLPKTRDQPSDGHLSFVASEAEEKKAGSSSAPNLEALSNSLAEASQWLEKTVESGEQQVQGGVAGFQALIGGLFGGNIDTSDAGLEKMFSSMDANGSGKLSEAEMKAAIMKVYGNSGLVVDEAAFKTMMRAADTNRDGKVDLEEFKVMMRAGPEVASSSPADVISGNEQLQDVLESARALIAQAEAQQQQLFQDVGSSVDSLKSAAVAAATPKPETPRTLVGAVGVEYKALLPYVNSKCPSPRYCIHSSLPPASL